MGNGNEGAGTGLGKTKGRLAEEVIAQEDKAIACRVRGCTAQGFARHGEDPRF